MKWKWRGGEVHECVRVCVPACVCVWGVVYWACRRPLPASETGAKSNFSSQVTRLSTQPSFKLLSICHCPHHHPHCNIIQCDLEGIWDSHEATWQARKSWQFVTFPSRCLINPTYTVAQRPSNSRIQTKSKSWMTWWMQELKLEMSSESSQLWITPSFLHLNSIKFVAKPD